jgi:class 3 adenylate cyclase/tetratricopeptide (TPR) repeat protein
MTVCAACGQENRDGARFCDSCGGPLAGEAVRELRKVVTILFCDVTGSTALGERLDSESLRRVMERYFALARTVLERHGGTVEKFIGDAVMAVFGIPVVHEDDALRAARAAAELRDGLAELNSELQREFGTELQVRIGINTGEVVTNEGGTLATGDAVNVAARLEQAAQPGDILVGDTTRQLAEGALELEPVAPVLAKGKSEPLLAYRLTGVRADAPAFERRFDAPFVGRGGELEQLSQVFGRAVRDRSCQLFTVLGPAGIGKSRVVHEFVASAAGSIVLRGRCLAYGEGITYFPLVEVLEQIAAADELSGLLRGDAQRELLNEVSAAIGVVDDAVLAREDTFRAVRMLLELLAQSRPVILVLDDLHWAEPTFLDLVDHIADWSRDAPIFLLCVARPDLLDARPAWGGGKLNAATILLEPLSESDAETLIDNLLVGGELPERLRGRITSAAEGNPLFVEQMLALIAQGGGNGNGEVVVPPTIQALLATRLEQLPSPERVAAERASVIGKEFWRTALAEIGGETAALPGLVRKELIRPHRSPIFPLDDAYRFRHQLIRDAAYDGMPKELRAELHERFGAWLQTNRSEYDEIVGYHLEQAFQLKSQLGRADVVTQALATRAGHLLGSAGRRAYERGDTPAAINLLSRATSLLPRQDTQRLKRLMDLGNAYHDAGELERARASFVEVIDEARAASERALELRGEIGLVAVEAHTGGGTDMDGGLSFVQRRVAELEELGDQEALAEGWFTAATLESWLGRSEAGGASYRRAVEHARRAGSRRLEADAAGAGTLLQAWGCVYAPDGVRACDELLAKYAGTSVEPPLRMARALHLSFMGDDEAAQRDHRRGVELFTQFGNELLRAASSMGKANHALRAGRVADAEGAARQGVADLERLDEQGFQSTTLGMLGEALYRQGRWDEADQAALRVAELALPGDFDAAFRWRALRARVLARRGEIVEAERLAHEAVEIVESTDWYMQRGEAALTLGEVMELAGRTDEARAAYERAVESFDRKGMVPDAAVARDRLDALG